MPAKYPDAIGYLNDLAKEVGEDWFTMICNLSAIIGKSSLDKLDIETLLALFTGQASYLGITSTGATTSTTATATLTDFLETLYGFSNFKLLPDTLKIEFRKRITIVFGANGSGKSSLCEALKVLANPEKPIKPLHNVRKKGMPAIGFNYKFQSDTVTRTWSLVTGYGPKCSTVKYFDTGIALKNVRESVDPGRVIELTPFKLHVFEWTKALTTQFRETLQQAKLNNAAKLSQALEEVRVKFVEYKKRPLASIDEKSLSILAEEIKIGELFNQLALLENKQATAVEMEKAISEEGLKLLKAEHRELEEFMVSINTLISSAGCLWELKPIVKKKELLEKQLAQELFVKELIPDTGTLETYLSLLRAASQLCNLDDTEHQTCPLCKRELNEPERKLFKRYYELLSGQLETEINTLKTDLVKAEELVNSVDKINPKVWDKWITLSLDVLADAKANSELVIGSCGLEKQPNAESKQALASLKELSAKGAKILEQKKKVIEAAAEGKDEVLKQLKELNREIEPLKYAQLIETSLDKLKEVQRMADEDAFWASKLPSFTSLMRKITDSSKGAHEELVVSDFEMRLNAEYEALTEKPMEAFGVSLCRKGSEASVTVVPQIGGKDIDGILSEGEQRVHSLALFFAELETCPQPVIVFDDPISSFDYNYIANYCIRLRDFTLDYPDRQIIVLTHNWEFFVQLQTTINQAGLNGHMSVQVLENCAMVNDYSEKVDNLKEEITNVLMLPSEPTKTQKEELAGKMRRLIEAVVNTHVFNNQRHQYKQKSQAVSDFQNFTQLVPLEPTEATTLKELYAKLSIPEHDDPRNSYVNTDKATFETRYYRILAVEAALISRK
ncbi:MAG: chromosome segregation protein SMC [Firmicutes bacterium HGW-Firmicutes-8]|nr:MAG: chromosome segregation protein SMC [Firmicutes bacterium HGW-Firmicutes-8]